MQQKKRKENRTHFIKRKREHLIDVKENNLRSKESLMRDDRQQVKERERETR
jgi:hypothetical protein